MKFYSLPLIPNQKPNMESFHTDLPQTEENAQVDWQALEEYCSILPSLSPELLESSMDPTFDVGTVNLPVIGSDSASPTGFAALEENSNFLHSLNPEGITSVNSSSTVSVAESQQESDEYVPGTEQTTPTPELPEIPGGIFDINQLFPFQIGGDELDFDPAFAHPLDHDL